MKVKMTFDARLQLLGMLGVLGGLIALVIELNQSQKLARATAYQVRVSEIQEALRELALSENLASILHRFDSEGVDSLTTDEKNRVVAWNLAIQWRMQGQFYQYERGFLEEAAMQRTLDGLANGIYARWEQLGLTDRIHPAALKNTILARLNQE